MSHRVVNRRHNRFFMLENELLDTHARRMGVAAYAIYTALVRISGNNADDQCFPSYEYLAVMFDMSKNTVIKSLKKLKDQGYIDITRYEERCAMAGCNRTFNNTEVSNYNPYDPDEPHSNLYTLLDFEQIELEEDFVELGVLKVEMVKKGNSERNARRRKAKMSARAAEQTTAVIAPELEVVVTKTAGPAIEINHRPRESRPPAPVPQPRMVQQSIFGDAVEINPPAPPRPKPRPVIPEATEAFEFYKTKFGRGPVDGGGTKAWFEEQIIEFGGMDGQNVPMGLRRMKAAITRARQKGMPTLGQLRAILENQTVEEVARFDRDGKLKAPAGKIDRSLNSEDLDKTGDEDRYIPHWEEDRKFRTVHEMQIDFDYMQHKYVHGHDDDPHFWQSLVDDSTGMFTPNEAAYLNGKLKLAYQLHAKTLAEFPPEHLTDTWGMGKISWAESYSDGSWPVEITPNLPGVPPERIDYTTGTADGKPIPVFGY